MASSHPQPPADDPLPSTQGWMRYGLMAIALAIALVGVATIITVGVQTVPTLAGPWTAWGIVATLSSVIAWAGLCVAAGSRTVQQFSRRSLRPSRSEQSERVGQREGR